MDDDYDDDFGADNCIEEISDMEGVVADNCIEKISDMDDGGEEEYPMDVYGDAHVDICNDDGDEEIDPHVFPYANDIDAHVDVCNDDGDEEIDTNVFPYVNDNEAHVDVCNDDGNEEIDPNVFPM